VADVRWFGLNDYEHLIVPDLRSLGLEIATEGEEPAKVAVVMNHDLAPLVWRYVQRHRTPYISYVWDLPPFRLGDGRSDYVISVDGRLVTLPRLGSRYITRRGYYSRLHFVARHAAAVWTPSIASAGDVERRFEVGATAVQYCYNSRLFPDPDTLSKSGTGGQKRHAPKGSSELSLLTISRLTPPKNHEAVVRAAARLGRGTRVEVIGRGPSQASIEHLARTLGVSCRFWSGLSGEQVVAAYRNASVTVCPSRFEGLGLTGIESSLCGTPVAASDIAAHREFLGSAAQFFSLDDDDGLARAIEQARAAGPPPTAHFASLTIPAAARRFFDRLQGHL
jgi:glycosyltransferase involved in cell wall biosynthesis